VSVARFGPTINVVVGHLDRAGEPALDLAKATSSVLGLVDTGAGESAIDQVMAERLGLPVVHEGPLGRYDGIRMYKFYRAVVSVPALGVLHHGEFAGLPLAESGFQPVLLGRTFLRTVVMTYDGARDEVSMRLARK